ncbi:MAG: acyl-CoA dehydrogenase family protein [Chloroflexi bacterium]|nr:acyl-CoA dehydrogenase family protein [Chloroflexota bacterium]
MDFTIPEEHKQIQALMRRFVRNELMPLETQVEEKGEFPPEIRRPLIKRATELGLRNLSVPEKFGGGGLGLLGQAVVEEEVGWTSPGVSWGVVQGWGWSPPASFCRVATPEQMEKYFYPVLRGEAEECGGFTEPNAGSDAANIQTTAVKRGDSYVINGTKHFITNADRSSFAVITALTDPVKRARGGITHFIVEFGTPGFSLGAYQPMMGRRGTRNYELVLQDCVVPEKNILGDMGGGARRTFAHFAQGRLLLGALFCGTAERALEMAKSYAKRRATFGQPLASRQAVQWMLVDMAVDIHATRMMTHEAAWEGDQGQDIRVKAAMVKLYSAQMVCRAVDNAIQVHGGIGYSRLLPLERMYRDARLFRIGDGTDEIMKMVIARDLLQTE